MEEIRVYVFNVRNIKTSRKSIENYSRDECIQNCDYSLSLSELEDNWNDSDADNDYLNIKKCFIKII